MVKVIKKLKNHEKTDLSIKIYAQIQYWPVVDRIDPTLAQGAIKYSLETRDTLLSAPSPTENINASYSFSLLLIKSFSTSNISFWDRKIVGALLLEEDCDTWKC